MKKILAIIAGMLAVASCRPPESTFSAQNVADYFTYKDGTLYNDYGNTFAITQDNTDGKWKVDGGRMYAIFDILNAQLDIVLKQYLSGTIKAHSGVVDKENLPAGDPVVISDCNIGGGYLNVMLTYYYKEGTDCPHDTRLLYDDDGQTLRLYLVHDGAGENPVAMDKDSLKSKNVLYCFQFLDMVPSGEYRSIVLDVDILNTDINDKYMSRHISSDLYGRPVQF
ncbi:MAG: hypothetical protein IJK44_03695 [Bacteroidales bacterium]|nr:hypothetical protein [Bacteroidales bacterium]